MQWEVQRRVAKKYLLIGIACVVLGAALLQAIPAAFNAVVTGLQTEAVANSLLDLVLTTVRWTLFPLGATLIGGSLILRELAGQVTVSDGEDTEM